MALEVEEGEVVVELLRRMVASVEVGVVGQAMRWEEEVAEEEDHLIQAAVALALLCLGEEEEARVELSFRWVPELGAEVAAAFLQLQHSRPGRKSLLESPLEEAAEDHLNERVEEVVLKRYACPRKVVEH